MRTAMKWIGRGALALVALLILAAGVVYAVSERKMSKTYEVDAGAVDIPTDSASIAEGERLARIHGCYDGCHGEAASGGVFVDDPMLGTLTAPDLTRVVRTMTDQELVRIIRHGVRADGSSVVAMPSPMFYHLTNRDLGAIIAFLRSLPPTDGPEADIRLGPLGRFLVAKGEFKPAAEAIDHDAPRLTRGDDPASLGRYVAMTSCPECHGPDLSGGFDAPNLAIAASYTADQFRTLMRTGESRDGRDLRLMDDVAESRFSNLTDEEINGLYTFLTSELARTQTSSVPSAD